MRLSYVRLGILALFAAFSAAFLFSFLVLGKYRDSYHVVTAFVSTVDVLTGFTSHIALYGIAPIAACLALSLLAFGFERKFQSDDSFGITFFFLSWPSAFWGLVFLTATFYAYSDSMRLATTEYTGVSSHLLPLYQMVGSIGVMWLITGIALIVLAKKSDEI